MKLSKNPPFRKFKCSPLFLCIIVGVSFRSLNVEAGGWTSTGGGSGVVCFRDLRTANLAAEQSKDNLPFTNEVLNKIEKVEALDLFEAHPTTKKLIEINWERNNSIASTPQDWLNLHNRVIERIWSLSPLFANLLSDLDLQFTKRKWVESKRLPLVLDQFSKEDIKEFTARDDANFGEVIDENSFRAKHPLCRITQIMVRKSLYKASKSSSYELNPFPDGYFEFEINYVPELFAKMNSLNKALIYLHEKLYLLGVPFGYSSSSLIRYWVRELALLEPNSTPWKRDLNQTKERESLGCKEQNFFHCPKPNHIILYRLNNSFGDYHLFFYKERDNKDGKSVNPLNKIFFDELKRFRKNLGQCIQSPRSKDSCYQEMVKNTFNYKSTQELQNIVYLGWIIFENRLTIFNYEYLVDPGKSPKARKAINSSYKYLCELIENSLKIVPSELNYDEDLYNRMLGAQDYCEAHKTLIEN